jgi:hypothetical protein
LPNITFNKKYQKKHKKKQKTKTKRIMRNRIILTFMYFCCICLYLAPGEVYSNSMTNHDNHNFLKDINDKTIKNLWNWHSQSFNDKNKYSIIDDHDHNIFRDGISGSDIDISSSDDFSTIYIPSDENSWSGSNSDYHESFSTSTSFSFSSSQDDEFSSESGPSNGSDPIDYESSSSSTGIGTVDLTSTTTAGDTNNISSNSSNSSNSSSTGINMNININDFVQIVQIFALDLSIPEAQIDFKNTYSDVLSVMLNITSDHFDFTYIGNVRENLLSYVQEKRRTIKNNDNDNKNFIKKFFISLSIPSKAQIEFKIMSFQGENFNAQNKMNLLNDLINDPTSYFYSSTIYGQLLLSTGQLCSDGQLKSICYSSFLSSSGVTSYSSSAITTTSLTGINNSNTNENGNGTTTTTIFFSSSSISSSGNENQNQSEEENENAKGLSEETKLIIIIICSLVGFFFILGVICYMIKIKYFNHRCCNFCSFSSNISVRDSTQTDPIIRLL